MSRGLSPERIEEILNARKERAGFMVAASDYDDLVLAYKDLHRRLIEIRDAFEEGCAPLHMECGVAWHGAIRDAFEGFQ